MHAASPPRMVEVGLIGNVSAAGCPKSNLAPVELRVRDEDRDPAYCEQQEAQRVDPVGDAYETTVPPDFDHQGAYPRLYTARLFL